MDNIIRDEKLARAYSKLINSSVIKSIYPMLDHIDIVEFEKNPISKGYDMKINIFINDPEIKSNNMYSLGFDPYYLTDYHLHELAKYLALKIRAVHFRVYDTNEREFFKDLV
jgi:hypothetical protein